MGIKVKHEINKNLFARQPYIFKEKCRTSHVVLCSKQVCFFTDKWNYITQNAVVKAQCSSKQVSSKTGYIVSLFLILDLFHLYFSDGSDGTAKYILFGFE